MHSQKGLQAPRSGLTLLRALAVSWTLWQRKQSPNVLMKTKEFKLLVSGSQLHRITELPKEILKKKTIPVVPYASDSDSEGLGGGNGHDVRGRNLIFPSIMNIGNKSQ